MQVIALTQEQFALVDDEDFDWLQQWLWCYHNGYALRYDGADALYMHNAIAERHNLVFSPTLDHKDRNGINNQKTNFRSATNRQNQHNHAKVANNKSGYIGVCRHKANKKWVAGIRDNSGKLVYLGSFIDKVEAAKAYDKAEIAYRGDRAVLNFPKGD